MFANPKWFSPRKYSGWGLTPNCWQGWAYIGIAILPFVLLSSFPLPGKLSTILIAIWGIVFAIDIIDIFSKIKKDERDILHEAIAERNAMWFVITTLAIGLIYQSPTKVDPVILITIFGGLIVKAVTNFYLRDK